MNYSSLLTQLHYYFLELEFFEIPLLWFLLFTVGMILGIIAAVHALFNKSDPRAALGWIVVCLAMPGMGAFLYVLMGINRIQGRARSWESSGRWKSAKKSQSLIPKNFSSKTSASDLQKISAAVVNFPLVGGCKVQALYNGEAAYPRMLEAIQKAKKYIFLSTYIFESNQTGRDFVQAFVAAQARGVDIKILIDGVGVKYNRPRMHKILKKHKIPCLLFLPPSMRNVHLNLRMHRKILVVDGEVGFTGGMNIGDRHLVELSSNDNPTQDIHFEIHGPVIAQLEEAFLIDWTFSHGELPPRDALHESSYTRNEGDACCRGIIAGPNEDFEKLRWVVLGAFAAAKKRLYIMNPYFIPDAPMITLLALAVMRGVDVEIILPEKNNLPYIQWATQAYLPELISRGIKIFYQPLPFAHSKYLLVDDDFVLIGSSNLDPRSLLLNFEFNLEIYDHALNHDLARHFQKVRALARPIFEKTLSQRSFFIRFRDHFSKLFSPYL